MKRQSGRVSRPTRQSNFPFKRRAGEEKADCSAVSFRSNVSRRFPRKVRSTPTAEAAFAPDGNATKTTFRFFWKMLSSFFHGASPSCRAAKTPSSSSAVWHPTLQLNRLLIIPTLNHLVIASQSTASRTHIRPRTRWSFFSRFVSFLR